MEEIEPFVPLAVEVAEVAILVPGELPRDYITFAGRLAPESRSRSQRNTQYSSGNTNRLDELVKGKHKVVIRFGTEKPGQDSKLWPRLRKCQNWDEIQHQLEQVQQGQSPEIAKIISPGMSAALTGGEILLIAWIALLLTGLLCYAIYKGDRAKVRGRAGKDGQPEGEIILEPPQG